MTTLIETAIDHATAAVTGDSPDRLAKRRANFAEQADLNFEQRGLDELAQKIADSDAKVDRATDKHQQICQPLQAKLTELETRIKTALADRLPVNESDEAERREILDQLASENEALAREAKFQAEYSAPFRREYEANRGRISGKLQILQNQLATEGYADPRLLDEYFTTSSALTWAQHRFNAATEGVNLNKDRIATELQWRGGPDREAVATYRARLRRYELELAAAQKAVATAKAEAARLYQQLIDE